ncbi:MAG: hypothetical protein KatS3mg111_0092 [Pirellulaceae bacterium]|nr:MAG: hypothetical protein KatS3mg111_0092 [Pirellulaceae bacterium]
MSGDFIMPSRQDCWAAGEVVRTAFGIARQAGFLVFWFPGSAWELNTLQAPPAHLQTASHRVATRRARRIGGPDAPAMNDRATLTASQRDDNQGRRGGGGLIVLWRLRILYTSRTQGSLRIGSPFQGLDGWAFVFPARRFQRLRRCHHTRRPLTFIVTSGLSWRCPFGANCGIWEFWRIPLLEGVRMPSLQSS